MAVFIVYLTREFLFRPFSAYLQAEHIVMCPFQRKLEKVKLIKNSARIVSLWTD